MRPGLILKLSSPDQPGIVARIASYVASHRGNLIEFSQFSDRLGGKFFARLEIDTTDLDVDVADFTNDFGTLGRSLHASWHFRTLPYKMRIADLDAGPIIEQEVERVSHFHSPSDLARLGRQCERIALAKGIRYHVHDRTLIDGHRAIVFPD